MRISDFDLYCELFRQQSGLSLRPGQSYLIESRLTPVVRKWGYPTLQSLTLALRGMPDKALLRDVIEAMTDNATAFICEGPVSTAFQTVVMPYLIKNRKAQRSLRLWSAGCATGQEPYSLAVMLHDMIAQIAGWDIDITATDISHANLEHAAHATYSQYEVQHGLPVKRLMTYFEKSGTQWQAQDKIRKMVSFEPFNLVKPMDDIIPFDVILCRNVLSIFDEDTQDRVLRNLRDCLEQDGFLFVGAAETLPALAEYFTCPYPGTGLCLRKDGAYKTQDLKQAVA